MLAIYLASFAFGIVFVSASAFLGGHDTDKDVGADAHGDADGDADGDHGGVEKDLTLHKDAGVFHASEAALGALMPFLSLRFWTYFATSFGATGAGLSLVGLPLLVHLPLALLVGVACGYFVAWVLQKLKASTVRTENDLDRVVGAEVDVLLSVGPDKTGKVRMRLGGQEVELPAVTKDGHLIERGQRALVVSVEDGRAMVTSLEGRHKVAAAHRAREGAEH